MTDVPRDLDRYFTTNAERIRQELFELLTIPSVSARSEHNDDTARTAEWVARSMRDAGLQATVHRTAGHPIVVGEWRGAGSGAPTVPRRAFSARRSILASVIDFLPIRRRWRVGEFYGLLRTASASRPCRHRAWV